MTMGDADLLRLVSRDNSSDYSEGVGEFGGYFSHYVHDGVLTVRAKAVRGEDDDDLEVTERSWRLVPVEQHVHEDDGTVEGCPGCFGPEARSASSQNPAAACSRCGGGPVAGDARSYCVSCEPVTMMCRGCLVQHAREVLAEAPASPQTTFYHSNLLREKLQMAADIIAAYEDARKKEALRDAQECIRACSGLGDIRFLQVMASSAPADTGITLGTLRILAEMAVRP